MTRQAKIWVVVASLIAFVLLVWSVGSWLGLHGGPGWIFRGALWLLGALAAAVLTWYVLKRHAPAAPPSALIGAIDLTIRAARDRLARARQAKGSSLSTVPLVLWLGPPASGKTTVVHRSGLDPDLLGGEVMRGDAVLGTRAVNLWYCQKAVFVEAGGKLLDDDAGWSRLVGHLRPRRLRALLPRGEHAPRVAVVCFDCEELLKPGGGEKLQTAAATIRSRLGEVARRLGIQLPVYVLFTKVDLVPHFAAFVRSFSSAEAREVFGATLPWMPAAAGAYAEQLSPRVSAAMERLYHALVLKRTEVLAREAQPETGAAGYEFPRELHKLFPLMLPVLVEVSRPSHLHVNPFLRGFYFTGVRAVVLDQPGTVAQGPTPALRGGATQLFEARALQAAAPAPSGGTGRKVPEWMFVERLLREVLLRDRLARGISATGTRVQTWRRVLVGGAAAALAIWILGLFVSFAGNRRQESRSVADAVALTQTTFNQHDLPPADVLRRLDSLGARVRVLRRYEDAGAPLHLRWGVYEGGALFPLLRQVYFRQFGRLMFRSTNAQMVQTLQGLPSVPTADSEYQSTYNLLKAYLISTSYPAQSSTEFLSPVLMTYWGAGRTLDDAQRALGLAQFTLYARELQFGNPYQLQPDEAGIARARAFLRQFTGSQRIYQFMLAAAAKGNANIEFNQLYPGSASALSDTYVVPAAFTAAGWEFMGNALKHVDRFFSGESWVLGEEGGGPADVAQLSAELRARYRADYVGEWHTFLRSARVVGYSGVADAARKLAVLSSNQSPLLQLFLLVAQNTAVDSQLAATAFQPVQLLTPPSTKDQIIGDKTKAYMGALLSVQSSLQQISAAPSGNANPAVAQALNDAGAAGVAARQVAQGFSTDSSSVGREVERLLLAPTTTVPPLLSGLGASGLNQRGRQFCGPLERLLAEAPFRPAGRQQAALGDVTSQFQRGTGAIWSFYNDALQTYLERQGPRYGQRPGADLTLTSDFIEFFNRAAAFSDAIFPEGAQSPRVSFTFKPVLSARVPQAVLVVDGQTATFTRTNTAAQLFVWDGLQAQEAHLIARIDGSDDTLSTHGTWAVFLLFQAAQDWYTTGAVQRASWIMRHNGEAVPVPFQLNLGGAEPIFSRDYFSGVSCNGRVAR